MTKTVFMTLFALVFLSACGGDNTQTAGESVSGYAVLTLQRDHSLKEIHDAIIKAGEDEKLVMTEFKSNAIIAEKADDDESASATVVFDQKSITIQEETGDINADDLLEEIEEILNRDEEH